MLGSQSKFSVGEEENKKMPIPCWLIDDVVFFFEYKTEPGQYTQIYFYKSNYQKKEGATCNIKQSKCFVFDKLVSENGNFAS